MGFRPAIGDRIMTPGGTGSLIALLGSQERISQRRVY